MLVILNLANRDWTKGNSFLKKNPFSTTTAQQVLLE